MEDFNTLLHEPECFARGAECICDIIEEANQELEYLDALEAEATGN